ncbi:MAG: metallophosphoesterase [SAR324 cluster bacterium]|nr:metallophosphoesterase [SAR324 cluster bacterium]
MKDNCLLQFAVIADTHIRLSGATDEGGYASNRVANDRAKYVVDLLNKLEPDFVIHLGDLVHPIPALKIHQDAVKTACDIFAKLQAKLFAIPGNHDIGDKANGFLPAPVIDANSHHVFEKKWGPLYQSFSNQNSHFICLDTPLMNSGLLREKEQKKWLENELSTAHIDGLRIFVFTHYPLLICDPEEPDHYDNIDDPARSWLLDLFNQNEVEAVFSGHVHNVFVGVHEKTKYYSLPATSFVRPEYSELYTVGPADEYGRNDIAKLGFFFVKIYEDRHQIIPVRTYGAGESFSGVNAVDPQTITAKKHQMLGVTLRQGWGRRIELAVDGLDEFRRKEAYRDGILIALLELGIRSLRVPLADLTNAEVRRRMADYVKFGFNFTVFSLGKPDAHVLSTIESAGSLILNWEIICPEQILAQAEKFVVDALSVFNGRIYLAPVVPLKETEGSVVGSEKVFQHFASHGFSLKQKNEVQQLLEKIKTYSKNIGLTFRVTPWDDAYSVLQEIDNQFLTEKLINLQLPRLNEGVCFEDDQYLQTYIVEVYQTCRKMSKATVFLDTFIDSDRGYYPRNGLLDRRLNPRPAFHALKKVSVVK